MLFTFVNSLVQPNGALSQVAVLDLRTPNAAPKILIRGGSDGRYVATGHLVYVAGDTVRAVPFDLERLEVQERAPVSLPLPAALVAGIAGDFAISDDGTVLYVPVVKPFVKTSAGETNGSISPDGRWLAF